MSEIPEDVMNAAIDAFKDIPRVSYALWGTQQLGTAYVESHAIKATAQAILAETERCAKIAEDKATFHKEEASVSGDMDYAFHRSLQRNFEIIAAAIRRR